MSYQGLCLKRTQETSAGPVPVSFPDHERQLLLRTPGISHGVVGRIERQGVGSLRELLDRGVDTLVEQICRDEGNLAWHNRRRALSRALAGLNSQATFLTGQQPAEFSP